jgi:hypothetical protein
MAAKSSKAVVKKTPAKKTPKKMALAKKANPLPAKAVDVMPDLMPPEVVKQITQVEGQIARLEGTVDAKLVQNIKGWAAQAAGFSRQAVQAGASALVYAWACGKLLNTAKEELGHGAFGKWREQNLESNGISVRTATRYMLLAKRCHDIRGLLQWVPTLRQAYIECGILPEPPDRGKEESDVDQSAEDELQKEEEHLQKEVLRKKEVLLASVSDLQQRLHQGISIKESLDSGNSGSSSSPEFKSMTSSPRFSANSHERQGLTSHDFRPAFFAGDHRTQPFPLQEPQLVGAQSVHGLCARLSVLLRDGHQHQQAGGTTQVLRSSQCRGGLGQLCAGAPMEWAEIHGIAAQSRGHASRTAQC